MTPEELALFLLGEDVEKIAFRPGFGRALSSPGAALFLSQALFWQRIAGPGNWFYKLRDADRGADGALIPPTSSHRQSWEWELGGMGRRDQEEARKILKKNGLLEEKLQGVPARLHFRVNLQNLVEFIHKNQKIALCAQQAGQNPSNKLGEGCPSISETKAEITSSSLLKKIVLKNATDERRRQELMETFGKEAVVAAVKKLVGAGEQVFVSEIARELNHTFLKGKKNETSSKSNEQLIHELLRGGLFEGDYSST